MATTDSIKFKAKSWVDVFGGRASKAVGSLVTNAFKKPVAGLMFYGALISLGIASVHLLIAALLGSAFERLLASGHIVGMDGARADRYDSGVTYTCVCMRARGAHVYGRVCCRVQQVAEHASEESEMRSLTDQEDVDDPHVSPQRGPK